MSASRDPEDDVLAAEYREAANDHAAEVEARERIEADLDEVADTASGPDDFWAEFDQVAAAIGARWPEALTAEEAVREQRRDL